MLERTRLEVNLDSLIPILGGVLAVLVGWLLNEFGHLIRARREERHAIGRIVADLLEIRHDLLVFELLRGQFTQLGLSPEIGAQLEVYLKSIFKTALPHFQSLAAQYDAAVDALAASNPVLAFRLRPQHGLPDLLDLLRSVALSDSSAWAVWHRVEAQVTALLGPQLEDVIRELAWAHGWRTWFQVRKRLRRGKQLEIPPELEKLLRLAKNLAQTGAERRKVTDDSGPH